MREFSENVEKMRALGVTKKCRTIGCVNKVLIGDLDCEECRAKKGREPSRHRSYNRFRRDRRSQRFYESTAWRNKRKEIIRRDKGRCQACERRGIITVGNVVHHIEELKDNWERRLDSTNLEVLCHSCHNKIHGR